MSEPSVNASTLPVADEPVLVGREQELGRFDKILEARQPYLAIVTGGPGVGKTSLMQAFRSRAEAAGWNTTPPGAASHMPAVTPETTEEEFGDRVQALLTAPGDQSFIEKSPGQSSAEASSTQPPLHPVVEQLRARLPMLLLIDGYQPSQGFADWFRERFLPDLKRSGAAVAVVVAERPEWATKFLSPQADMIFFLGKLEEQTVRQHFTIIGSQISPQMKEGELNAYVEASIREPELLSRLTRALALALRPESQAAGHATPTPE